MWDDGYEMFEVFSCSPESVQVIDVWGNLGTDRCCIQISSDSFRRNTSVATSRLERKRNLSPEVL